MPTEKIAMAQGDQDTLTTGCINSSVLEPFLDAENIVFLKISRELLEAECDSRGRVPRIVKLLDNPPNSRAVFLVIAGAFVHDRRPTITPNRIFAIAGLIGKGSDSSASGKIKSDCFLPHRCIQKHRSFFYERDPLELPQPLYVHWYFDKSEFRTSE
jgi:hypothetical protein